jgi:hypothetical protein
MPIHALTPWLMWGRRPWLVWGPATRPSGRAKLDLACVPRTRFERSRSYSSPRNAYRTTGQGNFCHRPLLALFALLTALAPRALAQRTTPSRAVASRPTAIPRFNLPTGSFAFGGNAHPSRFHRPSPYTSLLFPFLGDSFNPDDIYSTGYPVASQPPVILLQPARATIGSPDYLGRPDNDREPPSPQPLMIELQGGRYVRVSSAAADGEALPLTLAPNHAQADNTQPSKSTRSHSPRLVTPNSATAQGPVTAASPARDLPPAILVFRDGHSQEVRDYTIADGFLYARGDYYTDGYWNKKIDLSTLNLTQTLQANTDRNVKFVLPSSPNEVITRP